MKIKVIELIVIFATLAGVLLLTLGGGSNAPKKNADFAAKQSPAKP